MIIVTILTTTNGLLTEATNGQRSTAELLLAYLVWGAGVLLFVGPLQDLVGGSGADLVYPFLLVYPVLIQLPLLIHYDRRLGFTASPHLRSGFFGARLFHPVLIYGVFLVLWGVVAGLLTGMLGPSEPVGRFVLFLTLVPFSIVGLLAYFPVVILAAYILKGLKPLRSVRSHPGEDSDKRTAEPMPPEKPSEPKRGAEDGASSEHDQASPPANGNTSSTSPNVRFVSLLGLVIVPIGAGWYTGRPGVGISAASLFLTVYEMSYKSQGSE